MTAINSRQFDNGGMEQSLFSVQQPKTMPTRSRSNMTAVAVSFDDFTKSTTFHGIRYIFGNGMIIRRFIWLMCVTAAITLFTVQVIQRSRDYVEYNTNVDVVFMYDKKITFPAVTICNQNTFKLSSTTESHVYNLLYDLYSNTSMTEADLLRFYPALAGDDMATVVTRAGHKKEDFIVNCKWRNKPCNMSEDFQTISTEFGVCFTFNGNGEEVLMADKSGANRGLALKLNVERYEYMVGPQSEIGIQVLLQDQSETPLMESLGFAIAPGTHTLVGITRREEHFMDEPYGNCDQNASPMTMCTYNKLVASFMEQCGCVDALIYSTGSENVTTCNATAQYFCVNNIIQDDEFCPIPCERTVYGYSLSYALLAQNNIQNLIYPDPKVASKKLEILQSKLINALEASHRFVKEIVAKDEFYMNAIKHDITDITNVLELANKYIDSNDELAKAFGQHNILQGGDEMFTSDIATANRLVNRQYKATYIYIYESLTWYYPNVWNDMRVLLEYISNCTNPGNVPHNNFTDVCNEVIDRELIDRIGSNYIIQQFQYSIFTSTDWVNNQYPSAITLLYNDTGVNLTQIEEHTKCDAQITKYRDIWNKTGNLFNWTLTLVDAVGSAELETAHLLQELLPELDADEFVDFVENMLKSENQHCFWITKLPAIESNQDQYKILVTGREKYARAHSDHLSAVQLFEGMTKAIKSSYVVAHDNLYPLIESVDNYRRKAITMRELTEEMDPSVVEAYLYDLSSGINKYALLVTDYQRKLQAVPVNLKEAWRQFWSLGIPIFNYTEFYKMELWANYVQLSNSSIVVTEREYIERRLEWPPDLDQIIDDLYKPFLDYPLHSAEVLLHQLRTLTDNFNVFLKILRGFKAQIEINNDFFTDNFLEVDIFYKELKYEKVTQRPSFALLSLLSEVGGFLGLLLGASILTVCEVLDYLVISVLAKCKDNQKKKAVLKGKNNVIHVQPMPPSILPEYTPSV